MKVQILESARRDLVEGFYFYEKQADGIGSYFLESMYLDVEALRDNAGIHPVFFWGCSLPGDRLWPLLWAMEQVEPRVGGGDRPQSFTR